MRKSFGRFMLAGQLAAVILLSNNTMGAGETMKTNDTMASKTRPAEVFLATMHSGGVHAHKGTGLQVALSTDGVTFRNIRGNDESPIYAPTNGVRDPIVLYRQGHWYLAYTYGPSIAPLVFVAKSPDLLRWTPVCSLRLGADTANNNYVDVPQWIVDPAGNVHLIACTDFDHHWVEIHPLSNDPATWGDQANWSAVTTLTDQDGKPLISGNSFVALHNGTYYMAFNGIDATVYYMRTSASLNSGWSAPRQLDLDSSVNKGDSENLLFLANGTLRYYISNGNSLKRAIWYVDSADMGVTWTSPKVVNFTGFDREGVNWAQFVRITDPAAIAAMVAARQVPTEGKDAVAVLALSNGSVTGGETNMATLITASMLQPCGQRYEAVVPDTLDLAERAKLSVHGLTSFLNPLDNYVCPIEAYYNMKPAAMAFSLGGMMNGGYNWGKIAQSILLARVMCGSEENLDIEAQSLQGMLAFRPGSSPSPSQTMEYPCMSRIMLALTTLQQQSPTPALRRKIQDYVQTHIRSAKVENDKAWYYDGPRDTATWGGLLGFWQQTFIHGTALRALSSWNMLDGDADSLTLARQMKNFLCQPKFWAPEAEPKAVISSDRAHFDGHHHSNAATLMGLCWYAGVAHDPRAMEFARSGYEYLRNWGIARIGLFGESCTVGDMTMLAMKLTDLGVGDYWEDVDSYVRNHLTEMQITDAKKMQAVVDQMPPAQGLDPKNTTSDQVVERTVGTYLSDSSHPSLVTQRSFRWTICCSGNCTPALYYAWEGITRYDDATKSAVINLLLNRASAWLDIDSYLPYEGKVVIRNKTARNISVRIPRWADKTAVHALVNGQQAQFRWIGQYLSLDNLASSAQITITFPMIKTVEQYTITWTEKDAGGGGQGWFESMNAGSGHETYTCTFKGNTLVDIAPRSSSRGYPLYQRDRERDSDRAPTNKVTRFVSSVLPRM